MAVVQYRIILDVGFAADPDTVDIATHHCAGPDTAVCTDVDVPDHQAIWIEPGLGIDRGCVILERTYVAHVNPLCCRYSRDIR